MENIKNAVCLSEPEKHLCKVDKVNNLYMKNKKFTEAFLIC